MVAEDAGAQAEIRLAGRSEIAIPTQHPRPNVDFVIVDERTSVRSDRFLDTRSLRRWQLAAIRREPTGQLDHRPLPTLRENQWLVGVHLAGHMLALGENAMALFKHFFPLIPATPRRGRYPTKPNDTCGHVGRWAVFASPGPMGARKILRNQPVRGSHRMDAAGRSPLSADILSAACTRRMGNRRYD